MFISSEIDLFSNISQVFQNVSIKLLIHFEYWLLWICLRIWKSFKIIKFSTIVWSRLFRETRLVRECVNPLVIGLFWTQLTLKSNLCGWPPLSHVVFSKNQLFFITSFLNKSRMVKWFLKMQSRFVDTAVRRKSCCLSGSETLNVLFSKLCFLNLAPSYLKTASPNDLKLVVDT